MPSLGFLLKKLVGSLLMPLPVALFLGTAGWWLWLSADGKGVLWGGDEDRRRRRRARLGRSAIALSLLILWGSSCPPLSQTGLAAFEDDFPPFPGDSVSAVVVLASDFRHDLGAPPTAWLSEASLYRVAEGIRIAQMQPWARLMLPGVDPARTIGGIEIYREAAVALGMDPQRITLAPPGFDTDDESRIWASVVGSRPFALVTSASHMPRAMRLFERAGLNPVPAPTGHRALSEPDVDRPVLEQVRRVLPSASAMDRTQTAWYELLGGVWVWLTGLV
jgi:uncharacterized SAM-binding protein YcdF (DUF218 family)